MPKLKTATAEPKTESDLRPGGNARAFLFGFVERIERLEEEKAGIADDIKEVYGEAKGTGFDGGILRKVIQRRKVDRASRDEADSLLELYERTVEEEEKAQFDASVKAGS